MSLLLSHLNIFTKDTSNGS